MRPVPTFTCWQNKLERIQIEIREENPLMPSAAGTHYHVTEILSRMLKLD